MKYNPEIHHRRSIRLQGYDYSQPGAYFLTICTQDRECLFGEIVNGEMWLNNAGKMIQTVWDEIPAHYPGIDIDEFAMMPNHIHGIIVIVGAAPRGRPDSGQPGPTGPTGKTEPTGQPRGVAPTVELSLPDVAHRFKTMTTKRYADGVKQHGWRPFPGKLWQRNYWEHIVRNESELDSIRDYIRNNAKQWELDKLHPDNVGAAPCGRPDLRQQGPTGQPESRGRAQQTGKTGQPGPTEPTAISGPTGQPRGVAPTEIREPSATYGYCSPHSDDMEGWMV
jgi:putative transposase